MFNNPDKLGAVASQMSGLDSRRTVDLSGYDFTSLARTIKHESFWVFQLTFMGYIDSLGRSLGVGEASSASGVRPTFMIYCIDDRHSIRIIQESVGLPDSRTLLQ
jgi:hypothetical protein